MKCMTILIISATLFCSGCANNLKTMVAPSYQTKITPVTSLGITGQGASVAFPAFVAKGYKVLDIYSSNADPVEEARKKSIPYLATVDAVGTDGAWWDGFFDYSLRVTETESGSIVYSAIAVYGQSGISINQVDSSNEAMNDIVDKFAENFPPKRLLN